MFFLGATVFEISDDIKQLIENKALRIDKISVNILKLGHGAILHPLTDVINVSMRTGKFPRLLKIAVVHPLHEKVIIFPLIIISQSQFHHADVKSFKELFCEGFSVFFLKKNNICYPKQFGFKQKYITMALADLTKNSGMIKIIISIAF